MWDVCLEINNLCDFIESKRIDGWVNLVWDQKKLSSGKIHLLLREIISNNYVHRVELEKIG